jgi:RNA polymerase sigma-70 factor (TIGR02952 family)
MVGGACATAEPLLAPDLVGGLNRLRLALMAAAAGRGPAAGQAAAQSAGQAPAQTAGQAARPPGRFVTPRPRPSGEEDGEEPESRTDPVVRLVDRAVAGDAEAFAGLYDRYVDLVYRYVHYRVGGVALAEDLTSETFLRALRRISTFQWQGRDFGAWLVTIARNLIADHFKSGRYRLEIASADVAEAAPEPQQEGPEALVLDAISNAQLLAAVKRLGAEQQECIALRFLQGLSLADTARIMGKNEGAIKALQYRAVRALGRMMPPEEW